MDYGGLVAKAVLGCHSHGVVDAFGEHKDLALVKECSLTGIHWACVCVCAL